MLRKLVFWLALIFCIIGQNAFAQDGFGKNRVQYRKLDWKIYRSPHFAIRYYGDLNDLKQYANMQKLVTLLENQYSRYSSLQYFDYEIKERLNVVLFETHSDLEGHPIGDPFLPEGVGAFVEWLRVRMVLKQDFEPQLFERIVAHELVHQFQMKVMGRSGGIGRAIGLIQIPSGFIEGGAEYLTGLALPHTRSDVRDDQMRMMGSDIHLMPSWEALMADQANGYVAWKMVYDFLDAKFGEGTGIKLHVQGIKGSNLGLLIYRLSKGKLGNPLVGSELFNQEFFNHYNELYELDRARRPKPYQDTVNFKGRNITPYNHPQPMLCQAISPDGKRIACFTLQKYGVALVTFPISEEILYSEDLNEKMNGKVKYDESKTNRTDGKRVIINLTPQMVPIPYEYLVNPLETWPKNGSHIGWSRDGLIAFFARTGRDHMLYVVEDKEGGDVVRKISLDVDQGFSPSFSPDGKKVYFSAASHAVFDIYVVELETGKLTNLTDDIRYDTAPQVSPDGTEIVYVGNDGDFNHLFMLNLVNLSKKQITFNRYNDSSPSWSDDGKKLVFTSDEEDRIWSLYTLDLASNTRSFWFNPFGGVDTPIFARNSDDVVYCVVYRNDDTYHGRPYPNHEVFELKLKNPVQTETITDEKESNIYKFDSNSFFNFQLDPEQVNNAQSAPNEWAVSATSIGVGASTYWGMLSNGAISFENILKTKGHMFQFMTYSNYIRVFNYSYLNQENRMPRGLTAGHNRLPLNYLYYSIGEGRPRNNVINYATFNENSITIFGQYPRSKWTRFEFFSTLKDTRFDLNGLSSEFIELYPEDFNENDRQVFNLLNSANGKSLETGVALVNDTVIGSQAAQGPLHGKAYRFEVKAAPPLGGGFNGYATASADARIYRKLGMGTLLALRGEAKTTTRKSGELIVAGGSERFRGREWGSIIGNQLVYGSAELRFPLIDAIVFPGGIGIGSFRGLLFGDIGFAKFQGETFPAQKVRTYGAGIEFKPFQLIWAKQPNGKFKPNFYITFGW